MKVLLSILLLFFLIQLKSIAQTFNPIHFSLHSKIATIINTNQYSCLAIANNQLASPDLVGPLFNVSLVNANLNMATTITLNKISVEMSSKNLKSGTYYCELTGEDLLATWYGPSYQNYNSVEFSVNTPPYLMNNFCPIKCAQVQLTDDENISLEGQIKFEGTFKNKDNENQYFIENQNLHFTSWK